MKLAIAAITDGETADPGIVPGTGGNAVCLLV